MSFLKRYLIKTDINLQYMYMYMMKLTAPIPIRIKLAYQARIAMLYRPSKQIFKKGKFDYRIECT